MQGSGTGITLTAQNNGKIIFNDTITGDSNYTHYVYLNGNSTGQINLNGAVKNAYTPVSYTHLDVYKRQVPHDRNLSMKAIYDGHSETCETGQYCKFDSRLPSYEAAMAQ